MVRVEVDWMVTVPVLVLLALPLPSLPYAPVATAPVPEAARPVADAAKPVPEALGRVR